MDPQGNTRESLVYKVGVSKDFNIISNNEIYAKIFSENADRTCIKFLYMHSSNYKVHTLNQIYKASTIMGFSTNFCIMI